jgi:hypothetical protein
MDIPNRDQLLLHVTNGVQHGEFEAVLKIFHQIKDTTYELSG